MARSKNVFIFLMGMSVGFIPFLLTIMNFTRMENKIRDDKTNLVESDSSRSIQYLNRRNYGVMQSGVGQEGPNIER